MHQLYDEAFAAESPTTSPSSRPRRACASTSQVVGCPNDALAIGMPLEVVFERVSDDVAVPKFRPAHELRPRHLREARPRRVRDAQPPRGMNALRRATRTPSSSRSSTTSSATTRRLGGDHHRRRRPRVLRRQRPQGDGRRRRRNGERRVGPDARFAAITRGFDCPKPLIAAVNGVAAGGGFEIALACDVVIAADHARFGLPEPRVGLFAGAGGIHRLARQIPLKQAMGMLLTGRLVAGRRGPSARLRQRGRPARPS